VKYLESFGQSPLWEKIDKREFCQEIENSKIINFSDSEKLSLKSTFSKFHSSYFAVTDSDNALFMTSMFNFKYRLSVLGQALTRNKVIDGLIYVCGGRGSSHKQFYIGKLDDEWYLVEYKTHMGTVYYKCDQLDGFHSLLNSLTNKLKKRDFDLEKQKSDRNKKIQNIITKLKSMSWDEFVSFYDNFSRS
jgi:hypothetical protein